MGQRIPASSSPTDQPHVPVLLSEVLEALMPLAGQRVVDGTFGAGGYSRALLEAGAWVTGIDRDPSVIGYANALRDEFPESFQFVAGRFSQLDSLAGEGPADAVVLDIGVSSMQLDQAGRGFSFVREGPLDMRMSKDGTSAADLVNTLDEAELANLLYSFGEERKSRRIARAIVAARPIVTTDVLARVIEAAIGRKPGDMHPATRSFQALRIAVNAEFEELVEGLFAAERLVPEGGRLAVVTFHSIEDRIVKRFLNPEKTQTRSRHLPQVAAAPAPWTDVVKPIKAGRTEIEANPRARSATLRSARRSAAPARTVAYEGLGVPGRHLRGAA
jgi:16S rRNA (cytosine1402-N4)-methyltransferase